MKVSVMPLGTNANLKRGWSIAVLWVRKEYNKWLYGKERGSDTESPVEKKLKVLGPTTVEDNCVCVAVDCASEKEAIERVKGCLGQV